MWLGLGTDAGLDSCLSLCQVDGFGQISGPGLTQLEGIRQQYP